MEIVLTKAELNEGTCSREWLETNGLGGYASSTLEMCHRRKYHGLLVANLQDPPGRHVLISKFEDSIRTPDSELFLSAHQYPGQSFPPGGLDLQEFRQELYPIFHYEQNGLGAIKSLLAIYGQDTVLIRYEILKMTFPGLLRLRPFLAFRGYHKLARENSALVWKVDALKKGLRIEPDSGMPPVFITTSIRGEFHPAPGWYNNFEYHEERDRGYDWREDLYQPGVMEIPVSRGDVVFVSLSLAPPGDELVEQWRREESRREEAASRVALNLSGYDQEDRDNLSMLTRAAEQFLIRAPGGRAAIIAGYHWFTDWGRDSLISLPGLTFCQGRIEEGLEILVHLGRHEKEGLLPNYFSEDKSENPYNTVDSSLWFFWACQQFLQSGGSRETLKTELWPVLKRIIRALMAGTSYDIHVNQEGLLHAGGRDTHLTWMDACVGGIPVTPRWGYPVEINALWYNALGFYLELADNFGKEDHSLKGLFTLAGRSFRETFWLGDLGYLGDVYNEEGLDPALRPNQLLAVSLPYSPLDREQAKSVVAAVRKELLTPVGLRTLAPGSPSYRGFYGGDQATRDAAYHQGTVWPWLLGPFGEASLRVSEDLQETKTFLLALLRQLLRQERCGAGIGTISEVFSGDPPHRPQGCISQAWSLAEIIRLYGLLKPEPGSF
ncbi:MAG: amylo-alpha-1,6-glucosidase [Smithellaceae bacterium]|nr:amylo-alpha-1,6-glucosidase [Smithellaceae bacterium]